MVEGEHEEIRKLVYQATQKSCNVYVLKLSVVEYEYLCRV